MGSPVRVQVPKVEMFENPGVDDGREDGVGADEAPDGQKEAERGETRPGLANLGPLLHPRPSHVPVWRGLKHRQS